MLLAEIRQEPEKMKKKLGAADLVVTSFYHIEELDKLMPEDSAAPIGVNLQPEMSTIVKIARMPHDAKVGLVACGFRRCGVI